MEVKGQTEFGIGVTSFGNFITIADGREEGRDITEITIWSSKPPHMFPAKSPNFKGEYESFIVIDKSKGNLEKAI